MTRKSRCILTLLAVLIIAVTVAIPAQAVELPDIEEPQDSEQSEPLVTSPPPSPTPTPRPYNYTAMLDTITTLLLRIVQHIESEPDAAEPEYDRDMYLEYEYVMLYVLAEEILDEIHAQNELTAVALGFVAGAIIGVAVLSRFNLGV